MFGGKEPAVVFNGLAMLVRLTIPLLIAFDFIHWTDTQIGLSMALVEFIATFASTLLTRQSVVPTDRANSQIDLALTKPKDSVTRADILAENEENEEKGKA